MTTPARRLVLVGGGHAHLFTLKRAGSLVAQGHEVLLVTPQRYHYYSGMGPGLLSGTYSARQCRVDVAALARAGGGRVVEDRVVGLDPERRILSLASGGTLTYDLVSFNTGSRVPAERVPGAGEHATPVKPVENLIQLREKFLGYPDCASSTWPSGGLRSAAPWCSAAVRQGWKWPATWSAWVNAGGRRCR